MTVVQTPAQTQSPTQPQAPMPGTPEHDAALAAVFDSRQQQPLEQQPSPQKPAVPDFVPEKFRSAEDPLKAMAEAYAALEAKQTAPQQPATQQQTPSQTEAKETVQNAGLDFDALSTKYLSTGSLAAEDYASLEKAGIGKDMVDAYIAGQEAIADGMRNDVFQSVGGEDKFQAMAAWAGKSVPKAELKAFNDVMETGNTEQVKLAVAGLNARYLAAVGNEPNLLGGGASNTLGDTFRSVHELTEAMRDPRYAKDPAYRSDVEAKLARSSIM